MAFQITMHTGYPIMDIHTDMSLPVIMHPNGMVAVRENESRTSLFGLTVMDNHMIFVNI